MNFIPAALLAAAAAAAPASLAQPVHIGPGADPWIASADVRVHSGGVWSAASDGSLELLSERPWTGADALGAFEATSADWNTTDGQPVTTVVKRYDAAVVFEQHFPEGLSGTSVGDADAVISSFPTLRAAPQALELRYLTFDGNMACPGGATVCETVAPFPSAGMPGGLSGGVPLVVFSEQAALVVSPLTNFMAGSQTQEAGSGDVQCGLMGNITGLPPNFSHATLVSLSPRSGVNGAMQAWGERLRAFHGTARVADDFTNEYLGAATDNGAFYYYNTLPGASYADTLVALAQQAPLPFRYLQVDSWWYPKDPVTNGVTNWTSTPDVALGAVHAETGLPFLAHNRYWAPQNDYMAAGFDFVVGGEGADAVSMPVDDRFWDALFAESKQWGMLVYEQDWLHNEFERLPQALESPTLARQWLMQMGQAARRADVTIQYCMAYPRHYLQSVELDAVTQVRVSDDYCAGCDRGDQWAIGVSSMLARALDLRPFKDTFWSTPEQPGNPYSSASAANVDSYNATEVAPALEALVATLSTGAVAPGDGLDYMDAELVMRCCAADGRILQPSRPATAVDETFLPGAGLDGNLWTTESVVSGQEWGVVAALQLNSSFSFGLSGGVVFRDGAVADTLRRSDDGPLKFPALAKTEFQLWHTSPVAANGWALLGELDKFVKVSPDRFVSVASSSSADGMEAVVRGSAGEVVRVAFSSPDLEVVAVACEVGGVGSVVVSPSGCR